MADLEEAYTRARYGRTPYSSEEARKLVATAQEIIEYLRSKHPELTR